MSLGIERDARYLAEIHVVRQFERVGHGVEIDARHRLLSQCGRRHQQQQSHQHALHENPPQTLFAFLCGADVSRTPASASIASSALRFVARRMAKLADLTYEAALP